MQYKSGSGDARGYSPEPCGPGNLGFFGGNAGFNTPLEEKDPLTIPISGKPSGRTALAPGFGAWADQLDASVPKEGGKIAWEDISQSTVFSIPVGSMPLRWRPTLRWDVGGSRVPPITRVG
jgi:hypothetical protein